MRMSISSLLTAIVASRGRPGGFYGLRAAPRTGGSAADDRQDLVAPSLADGRIARLDVEAQEGFRVGRAKAEPPVVIVDEQPVGVVVLPVGECLLDPLHRAFLVGNLGVDLTGVPVPSERSQGVTERSARPRDDLEGLERGDHAALGAIVVAEVEVT